MVPPDTAPLDPSQSPQLAPDRIEMTARFNALIGTGEKPATPPRAQILAFFKDELASGRAAIRARLDDGASGTEIVRATTAMMDGLIGLIYDLAANRLYPAANPTKAERICIAAVGGYGRGELAPQSDIDLLFLVPYKETPRIEQIIEYILYMLWDLGLKVGQATRSVDECLRRAKADITIRTAILEARFLLGEEVLFTTLRHRFHTELAAGTGAQFVEAKLAERDARHREMGDTRYVLEPNIKDGKGGLRDLQTLYWIGKYLYRVDDAAGLVAHGVLTKREADRFARALDFLWTVRCHLHSLTGRDENRLTFDMQTEIATRLGYRDREGGRGVERFMRHYYLYAKNVGGLTRIFCAALETEHVGGGWRAMLKPLGRLNLFKKDVEGFPVVSGRLSVAGPRAFVARPKDMIRLFRVAQKHDLDIHPDALKLITRNLRLVDDAREDPDANRWFLEMLTHREDPEIALRRLNEAGVFGRFVPDFGRVVAMMQHDLYHVYTVDEHTIKAIGILSGIEAGRYAEDMPAASEMVHKVHSRNALYVGLFLHDIAKGRGGNHSEIGADIALELGARLGLAEEETETAAWLVRHHLAMSNIAFRRDINDPKTISDFAEEVQSVERLRLLLVLTVADIRAVGPNVWNGWKATLIRDLYYATETVLSGGHAAEPRDRRVQNACAALRAELADWPAEEVEGFIDLCHPAYWLAFATETHVRHAHYVREAEQRGEKLTIKARADEWRDATEITIYTADHAGLFSQIAGAIALAGANIVDAKIFTLGNGRAMDVFWVQDRSHEAPSRPEQLARLAQRIEGVLRGDITVSQALAERPAQLGRAHLFKVAPRVIIDNAASRGHTVIEVNGRDRPGLLHDITSVLWQLGLQIASAHITTFGERAVDVFYVRDSIGWKVIEKDKVERIRAALLDALNGANEQKGGPTGIISR